MRIRWVFQSHTALGQNTLPWSGNVMCYLQVRMEVTVLVESHADSRELIEN